MKILINLLLTLCLPFLAQAHTSYSNADLNAFGIGNYKIGSGMFQGESDNSYSSGYNFQITSDLIKPEKKDSYENSWYRGLFTDKNVVKVGYSSNDPRIASVEVVVVHGNVAFRSKEGTTMWVDDAIKGRYEGLDIIKLAKGETVYLDISKPGRNVIGWVVRDSNDSILYDSKFKETRFDALFDDGEWITCGEVELSSNFLKSHSITHAAKPVRTDWIRNLQPDTDGDSCCAKYPYYNGESWKAKLDYHPGLKRYRIVNPLTCNNQFKDYTVKKEETLEYIKNGSAEYPEAFLFDKENPSWFIINAEDPDDMYHEASSIGMMMTHNIESRDFFARKYHELEGCQYFTFDSEVPKQRIADGIYYENPDNMELSIISIKFDPELFDRSKDSGIVNIGDDTNAEETFYTLDGYKVENPSTGIFLKKKGTKVSKVIL